MSAVCRESSQSRRVNTFYKFMQRRARSFVGYPTPSDTERLSRVRIDSTAFRVMMFDGSAKRFPLSWLCFSLLHYYFSDYHRKLSNDIQKSAFRRQLLVPELAVLGGWKCEKKSIS